MDVDTFIEELLGKFVDIAIYDLYWNNSLFSSNEFSTIVTELTAKDKVLKVSTEKKNYLVSLLETLYIWQNVINVLQVIFVYLIFLKCISYMVFM